MLEALPTSGRGNELEREGRLASQLFHQKSSFGSGIYYYGGCGESAAAVTVDASLDTAAAARM
jgi:hypothetical protein